MVVDADSFLTCRCGGGVNVSAWDPPVLFLRVTSPSHQVPFVFVRALVVKDLVHFKNAAALTFPGVYFPGR